MDRFIADADTQRSLAGNEPRHHGYVAWLLAVGAILGGAMTLAFSHIANLERPTRKQRKSNLMSSSKRPHRNDLPHGKSDQSLVETLKEQDSTVDATTTDELLELPADSLSKVFEKQAAALSGFSAPLRQPRSSK